MGKKGTRRRKQGLASWGTSVIALILGLFPAIYQLINWLLGHQTFGTMALELNKRYNPMAGDRGALIEGYGALVGGIAFKLITSQLIKRARVTSAIPALTA